jgi:hypothetical protein
MRDEDTDADAVNAAELAAVVVRSVDSDADAVAVSELAAETR